jgi:hypothetical protein
MLAFYIKIEDLFSVLRDEVKQEFFPMYSPEGGMDR